MTELLGIAEIVELLGISRQRVHLLVDRADFPKPLAELKSGRVWSRPDVESWARSDGRLAVERQ